jgi:hypothetical protein
MKLQVNISNLLSEWREETFQNQSHLVVPCVMVVEGVHDGSAGPYYYPADEIAKFPEAWNGRPVPVFHQENCNSPGVIEAHVIGNVFNAEFVPDGAKLKGELWLNQSRTESIYPGLIDTINNGGRVEVSTGILAETDNKPGEWNGERYLGRVFNIRPDHLAVLPDGEGACNWTDGCGIRNQAKNPESILVFAAKKKEKRNYLEMVAAAQKALDNMDVLPMPGAEDRAAFHFIRAIYDDFLVFEKANKDGKKYFKSAYSYKDGEVKLEGELTEVVQDVQYRPMSNESAANQKEVQVAKKKENKDKGCCPDVDSAVTYLIETENSGYTEEMREQLQQLELSVLETMASAFDRKEEPAEDKESTEELEADNSGILPKTEDKEPTDEEWLSTLPPKVQATVRNAMAAEDKTRRELVGKILSNKRNRFTEEKLLAKELNELEAIVDLMSADADYSLNAGNSAPKGDKAPEPMGLPTIEDK